MPVLRLLPSTVVAALVITVQSQAALVFSDNFDNSFPGEPALIGSIWPKWPTATDHLNTSTCCITENHNHTPGGVASERQDPEDPWTLANYHDFGPVPVAVTATAWLWDDNSAIGVYAFPVNFYVGLYGDSTNGPTANTDYLLLGLSPTFADYNTYGYKSLTGGIGNTSVTRTNAIAGSVDSSGWVKLTIQADSLSSGGHVGFYINDVLVGTATRQPGVSLRYFFMGSQSKNYEWFWYDDISIEAAIPEISSIRVSGGMATIEFTSSDTNELASAFTLISCPTVNGSYTAAAGANISGSGGSYQATVSAGDTPQFYRIER